MSKQITPKKSDFLIATERAIRLMEETGKVHCVLGYNDGEELTIVRVLPFDEVKPEFASGKHVAGVPRVLFKSRGMYGDYVVACDEAGVSPISKDQWTRDGRPKTPGDHTVVLQGRPAGSSRSKSKSGEPRKPGAVKPRPTKGTTKQVWDICDSLVKGNKMPDRAGVIQACKDAGVNPATAATQYAAWKRSNAQETK